MQQVSAQAGGLNQKHQTRLIKALGHYMQEVWDENGPEPLPKLNRDVLMATTNDLMKYLRREQVVPETVAAAATYVADTRNQPMMEMASQRLAIQQGVTVPPRPTFEQGLLLDTGSRFEQLQQERSGPKETRPTVPDFQISLTTSSEEPSALSLFENARKAREEEAARAPVSSTKVGGAATDANPLVRFISPPSILGDANVNPTLALPNQAPAPRGPLPQDYLIKQDDVINYREVEYNLFLYSADRDWLTNVKETRYNFSVNFDPANNRQGFTLSPSSTKKFRNIQRIELVKCIMPTEGIDNLVTYNSTTTTYVNSSKLNILSFPYIIVRIPELDTNNFGTDNNLDNAFGVVQYDANWYTDTTNLSDGYLGMIPKFMKCQKVYHPTPLATLTRLTIQLQRPDGQYISDIPDTVSIQNIYASNKAGSTFPASFVYAGNYQTVTLASGAVYYLIQTSTWFSQWMFQKGNRIQIKGLNATDIANPATQAAQNFVDYLQQEDGLVIVGIGKNSATTSDEPNQVGYCNVIIVQAPLAPVTAATPDVLPFGGSTAANTALATALKTTTFTTAKLINLTHQTNVVLRIITREMDPTARVRPDNL